MEGSRIFHTTFAEVSDTAFVFVEEDLPQRGPGNMVRGQNSDGLQDDALRQANLQIPVPSPFLDHFQLQHRIPAKDLIPRILADLGNLQKSGKILG